MTKSDFISALLKKAESFGVPLSEEQGEKLYIYFEELVRVNEYMNLTAITEPEEVIVKHFCDCLALLKYSFIKENASVVDVGTGAGFPGVVIKIVRDDIKLTLMDAAGKRINFLTELCEKLGVDVECVHIRAEQAGVDTDFREEFDVAVSRAVAELRVLNEYCLPLVKVNGKFVALKGKNGCDEVNLAKSSIAVLGGKLAKVEEYSLFDAGERTVVEIKKVKKTSSKYPRHNSQIKSKPL
ncbi:MAG: 16S rRNA (guanine(527)-N(7))-methyltransferase RsmG [Clostridia bacterium]|nr:16S rRNA (guanine(527)-N(7))-methyltransferase RsmG [Clostridia bacterium]